MGKQDNSKIAKGGENQLLKELRVSLTNIDQWLEPSQPLYHKLFSSHIITLHPNKVIGANREVVPAVFNLTEAELQESDDISLLIQILLLHTKLNNVGSKIEKLIIIQTELDKLQGDFGYEYKDMLHSNYEKLLYLLRTKEGYYLGDLSQATSQVIANESSDKTSFFLYKEETHREPSTNQTIDEQTLAYIRVSQIFEDRGRAFWSGSLSDFVYAIDTLARNGYLKREELEDGLAEIFGHKIKGNDKVQKLTPKKIKDRRRALKSSSSPHKASTEIIDTLDEILNGMPSKRKES